MLYRYYALVVPLKDKAIMITDAFKKKLDKSSRKPSKIWIDKRSEFTIDQWNHGCKII